MVQPQDAQQEIMDTLYDHFDRTGEHMTPEKISEMSALDVATVENALRVLKKADRIDGVMTAEFDHPVLVTGITYEDSS